MRLWMSSAFEPTDRMKPKALSPPPHPVGGPLQSTEGLSRKESSLSALLSSNCDIVCFLLQTLAPTGMHAFVSPKKEVRSFSRVQHFGIPWTIACQAPTSMGFSRQEDGSGLPFPFQGIFPTQGSNLGLARCGQTPYSLSHPGSSSLPGLQLSVSRS